MGGERAGHTQLLRRRGLTVVHNRHLLWHMHARDMGVDYLAFIKLLAELYIIGWSSSVLHPENPIEA